MKNKFTIYDLRFTIWKKSANTAVAGRQSPIVNRQSQRGVGNPNSELRVPNSELRAPTSERGVALVITLILLSVTLVMAVAFLAISRRERNAVTTVTDTASARLAADAALANAEAQIVANIFATTNVAAYNFGLLVSTNYINGFGFTCPTARTRPTSITIIISTAGSAFGQRPHSEHRQSFLSPARAGLMSNLVAHTVKTVSTSTSTAMAGTNRTAPWMTTQRGSAPANGGGTVSLTNNRRPGMDWDAGPPGRAARAEQPLCIALRLHRRARRQHLDLNAIHNQVFDENNAMNSTVNPPPNGDDFSATKASAPGKSISPRFWRT